MNLRTKQYVLFASLIVNAVMLFITLSTPSMEYCASINQNASNALSPELRSGELRDGRSHSPVTDPNCPLFWLQRCVNFPQRARTVMRGTRYWVMYNVAVASRLFACNESVTYTTHGDFSFFGHLAPLVERWRGPVSFSVYAPGENFPAAIQSINYARQCGPPSIQQLVTFHVFFDVEFVPAAANQVQQLMNVTCDCNGPVPWLSISPVKTNDSSIYPVNVARNIARESATTHFVFPSDVELYPSANAIVDFLAMIHANQPVLCQSRPKVFVFSIFEVVAGHSTPENKTQLLEMLARGSAILFHKHLCPKCHNVPGASRWAKQTGTTGMSVFHVGKRHYPYHHWEPIYICTNDEPVYDERLSWNGKMDKMAQGYLMCNLDYDFMILDNGFLTHSPGIKHYRKDKQRERLARDQRKFILSTVKHELTAIFNMNNTKCHMK